MGSSGQIVLVIGAILLLGTIILYADRLVVNKTSRLYETEGTITATSIGQAFIEEVTSKRFDENYALPNFTDDVAKLVPSNSLGVDAGEVSTNSNTFDDIDDYNGYARKVSTPRLGNFTVSSSIYYIADSSPDVKSPIQTWMKRIDVKVRNPYVLSPDSTVALSKIVSYRYKK